MLKNRVKKSGLAAGILFILLAHCGFYLFADAILFFCQGIVQRTHAGFFFNRWRIAVIVVRGSHDLPAFDGPCPGNQPDGCHFELGHGRFVGGVPAALMRFSVRFRQRETITARRLVRFGLGIRVGICRGIIATCDEESACVEGERDLSHDYCRFSALSTSEALRNFPSSRFVFSE